MADLPRLMVVKGEAGVPVQRLCDSLSKVAHLVLVNVCSPTPHMETTHEEARAALAGRGELVPVASYESHDQIVQAVAGHPVDGIVTTSERCLILAADVAASLGLRFLAPDVARTVRDKYAQRAALRSGGIPCPAFARIASSADLASAAAEVGMPAVLKPESGAGGHDTYRVDSPAQLAQLYETARQGEIAIGATEEPSFILEEMLIGQTWHETDGWGDYASVENFHYDGETLPICISDRTPLVPPFRETGVFVPSSLPRHRADALRATAAAAATALGISHGITHTEIKFTADGPRIIEVNARLGGHMGYVFELASGRDVVEQVGRHALGIRPDTDFVFERHAGWILLTPPQSEKPVRAIGLDRIKEIPHVVSAVLSDATTFDWHLGELADPALVTVVAESAEALLWTRQRILETVEFR
jgi:biotin carboxylase